MLIGLENRDVRKGVWVRILQLPLGRFRKDGDINRRLGARRNDSTAGAAGRNRCGYMQAWWNGRHARLRT